GRAGGAARGVGRGAGGPWVPHCGGVLEPCRRACEHLNRLPEQPDSRLAALNGTEHAQGGTDGVRVTPTSSEREFFGHERTRFVVPLEESKAFGGPSAPRDAAWIIEGDEPDGLAHLEQLVDSPPGASGLDAQTAAGEPKPDEGDLVHW